MASLAAITLLLATTQQSPCRKELDWVIQYCEANLPSYQDSVAGKSGAQYSKLKATLRNQADQISDPTQAYKILVRYVEFFKDNHTSISTRSVQVDEKDPASLAAFLGSDVFKGRESVAVTPDMQTQYPVTDLRGVYTNGDGTYVVAVVPAKDGSGRYLGVILESKTQLWVPGQVKFELTKSGGDFEAFVYTRNHAVAYSPNYKLRAGVLGDAWFKTSLPERTSQNVNVGAGLEFKQLDSETAYVRVPSFSGGFTADLNRFYSANKPVIDKSKYLIIDVRNNGGGSDGNAFPLLNYIYTHPIKQDKVELYVTPGTIQAFEDQLKVYEADPKNFDRSYVLMAKMELEAMKRAKPGSYIVRQSGNSQIVKKAAQMPKAVAVIVNSRCASACESLVFWAKQSSKTIVVGENTGGYVGYGEVGEVETPQYKFSLNCSKTRYNYHRRFEVTGIPPDVVLSMDSDWIEQAKDLLKSGRKPPKDRPGDMRSR